MKAGGPGDRGPASLSSSLPFCATAPRSCHRVSHSNDAWSSTASSGPISDRLIRCCLTNLELKSLRLVQMTVSFTDISAHCPLASLGRGRGQSTGEPWVHFAHVGSQDFAITAAARVIERDAHSGTEGSSHRHMLLYNLCVPLPPLPLSRPPPPQKPSFRIFFVRDSQLRAWQHQLTPRRLAAHASCQHLQMPSQKPPAAYTGCPLLSET